MLVWDSSQQTERAIARFLVVVVVVTVHCAARVAAGSGAIAVDDHEVRAPIARPAQARGVLARQLPEPLVRPEVVFCRPCPD